MIPSLTRRLSDSSAPAVLLDGALGTQLVKGPTERPSRRTLTEPDRVRALHAAYFAAGADAVHTNTFMATRVDGLTAAEVRALNLGAALLAREVRPEGRWVLGDVSPPINPDAESAAITDAYAEQIGHLVEGGVDALHLETFFEKIVLRAVLAAVRLAAPTLPVLVSFAVMDGKTSVDQTRLGELVALTNDPQVVALGLNCSLSPAKMLVAFAEARALDPRFVLFQPVANDPPLSAAEFAAQTAAALAAGARAVGGCCGSTPEHIAALRAVLDR